MSFELSGPVTALRTRLFGFDKDEVRVCLQNLVSDYDAAMAQIQRLMAELQAAKAGPAPTVRVDTAGVQIEKVLASAHRIAEEVKADAERAAKEILREAQQEAAALRAQAEADATALSRTAVARLAEIELDIQDKTGRQVAVQAMLDRAADKLSLIAAEMRQALPVGDLPTRAFSQPTAIL
jgi:hypothetical protein